MEASSVIIVSTVIGARLVLPLFIPRFPLPAILACLLIDAADQTIFHRFTNMHFSGYQEYDKALDIYYLSVAYLSTFKNWTNHAAFKISQFLFYYRMLGDTLFETTNIRVLPFVFPNTFEYFFIFYSFVALRWNPKKLSTRFLLVTAGFIWIFIKVPQEYWIHIARLDTTDVIKTKIFNVSVNTPFEEVFRIYPWALPALVAIIVLIILTAWFALRKLPTPELKFTFSSRVKERTFSAYKDSGFGSLMREHRNDFIEKTIFVGLVSIVFAQIFPNFRGTNLEIFAGVGLVIFFNALFSYLLLNSSKFNPKLASSFFLMFVVNVSLAFIYSKIVAGAQNSVSFILIMFFGYILTLITVLYDKFKPFYRERFSIR